MKKTMFLGLSVAMMALSSFVASADSQYPASDFEPQVIYLDKNLAAQATAPTGNSQSAVPCTDNTSSAKAPDQTAANEIDPKYPAAHFQPKVIYP